MEDNSFQNLNKDPINTIQRAVQKIIIQINSLFTKEEK
jgi:hypothetical protein